MGEPLYQQVLLAEWVVTTCLQVVVLVCLFRRRGPYRSYPVFSAYLGTVTLQQLLSAWWRRHYGFTSIAYFNLAWGTQTVVLCARWLAVAELMKRVLAGYAAVNKMAQTLLFTLSVIILTFSFALANNGGFYLLISADRAVELTLAVLIAGMFVLVRYYRLAMRNIDRQLGIGFCLYSCAWVAANTIYQMFRHTAGAARDWDFLQSIAFVATLVIWIGAVGKPVEVRAPARAPALTAERYGQLSQELNERLRALDARLKNLFRPGDSGS